jgi:hypothetical protein
MMRAVLLILTLFATSAQAGGVPRCWIADQPNQDIQDGVFRVMIATQGNSALTVAEAFAIASQSMGAQIGSGATFDLSHVEIDLYGNLQYWKPTGTFPTLTSFKDYIIASFEPLLTLPGVMVECATVDHPAPSPVE